MKHLYTLYHFCLFSLGMMMLSGCYLGEYPLTVKPAVHNPHLLGQWVGDEQMLTIQPASNGRMQAISIREKTEDDDFMESVIELTTDSAGTSGFISLRLTDGMFGDGLSHFYLYAYFKIEGDKMTLHRIKDQEGFEGPINAGKLRTRALSSGNDPRIITSKGHEIRALYETIPLDMLTEWGDSYKRIKTP